MFSRSSCAALAIATGVTAALALSIPTSSRAAPIAGNCPLNAAIVKVGKGGQGTNSNSFSDVLDTGVRFTQGGSRAACILISFTAEALAANGGTMQVNAVLDGSVICEPSGNYFLAATSQGLIQPSSYAMNFLCTGVLPGPHSVKMQFNSLGGSNTVTLYARTVAVHYFK